MYDQVMTRKSFQGALIALLLTSAPGVLAKQLENSTSTGKAYARRVSEVGIRRFAEVKPGFTRGGDPGETGIRYLHAQGYRTVVSFLTDAAESAQVVNSGMKWIHIPMRSGLFSAQPPTQAQVDQFLAVVTDTTQYPVFIHCHAGKDRTGAMTALYRMQACGWTRDEALSEMDSFGFSGRYRRLRGYVQDYRGSGSSGTATAQASPAAPDLAETAGMMAPLTKKESSAPASGAQTPVSSSR